MSRRREREGRHVSIAGEPAEEVLETLVNQFADPYTFIRELLQNSLDARSARIDVRMKWAAGVLTVAVTDDGEGMDRPIIEGYLLTLFRSTKEDDLTKIGKFGIGFTSIFAMKPREVVVDTGRDGVWHRLVFDAARQYTLSRLADPYEGTTVTLVLDRGKAAASEDAERIRDAMVRWCRYADAIITVAAEGTTSPWESQPIRAEFAVEAPVQVRVTGDGFEAVLGPFAGPNPPIGFYNRGITLWESEEPMVPGVTFRVAGRHLEHTLTRDNVIRDQHFLEVLTRLRVAARDELGAAVHRALEEAARAGDTRRTRELAQGFAASTAWTWDEARPVLPGVRGPLSLRDLAGTRTWKDRLTGGKGVLWCGESGCAVAAALAAAGKPVLLGDAKDPHAAWAAAVVNAEPRAVRAAYGLVEAAEPEPRRDAILQSTGELLGVDVVAGRFTGEPIAGRLAVPGRPGALLTAVPKGRGPLVVNADHPLLALLDPRRAGGVILAVAIGADLGLPPDPRLVADLPRAMEGG